LLHPRQAAPNEGIIATSKKVKKLKYNWNPSGPQAEIVFTFIAGLLKFMAAFRLRRKTVTDKEILDLKIASVASINAKTIS